MSELMMEELGAVNDIMEELEATKRSRDNWKCLYLDERNQAVHAWNRLDQLREKNETLELECKDLRLKLKAM